MLWAGASGALELREGGDGATRLSARFPYGRETTLAEGGRTGRARKEVIEARAFSARIDAGEDIHLLVQHDFHKPLASRSAGSLELRETPDALEVEATIPADMRAVSYVADFLAAHRAGLIRGLSPGFRIAPVEGAERIEARGNAILRSVRSALLFEVSVVTRPAYPDATVEARCWQPGSEAPDRGLMRHLHRWRL